MSAVEVRAGGTRWGKTLLADNKRLQIEVAELRAAVREYFTAQALHLDHHDNTNIARMSAADSRLRRLGEES